MVCLGLEPRVGGWKAQTNPMSYGSTPTVNFFAQFSFASYEKFTIFSKIIGVHYTQILAIKIGPKYLTH